jgi:RimJ/RimL family protein N-acetyltransferase
MTVLRTKRLLLRQWRDSDRDPWAALNADPLVMEHFPATQDRAEADRWAAHNAARIDEHGWGLWAVEVAAGAPFIGSVGLAEATFEAPFTPCIEVSWRMAREHWGGGYAPEAAQAALDFGFDELDLDEIVSFTAVGNERSRRVMEKLGMAEACEFDHPKLPGHRLERHVLYRLGRTDVPSPRSLGP